MTGEVSKPPALEELRADVQLLTETMAELHAKVEFDRRLAAETEQVESNV